MYQSRIFFKTIIICSALGLAACAQQEPSTTSDSTKSASSAVANPKADLIIRGGRIYTGVDNAPRAAAIAVLDGEIVAVAPAVDEISPYEGENTRTIDLKGANLYPGFVDAHAHLDGIGERELILNLEGTPSVAALVATIKGEVETLSAGTLLYGRGWIETGWPEGRFPNRDDLDAVSPDNPVILERADGHAVVANSKALDMAGITDQTSDPSGGRIERDGNGRATGILVDDAASLVLQLRASPSSDELYKILQTGGEVYAAYGWTGLHSMSVNPSHVEILHKLAGDGALGIRVYNSLDASGFAMLEEKGPLLDDTGRITTRAIKLYTDGALGSRGALLFEPYEDQTDTNGLQLIDSSEVTELFTRALNANIQVNTHAIGDQGNALVLDWFEAARAQSGISPGADPRFRIEHAQIVRPQDIPRFAELGMIASMQPSHAIGDLHFAPDRLGDDRLAGAYAWRSMMDAGVIVAAGSDAPVERGDPRIEFYAAVARKDLEGFQGPNWHPQEAVSREDALKMLTLWPAYAAFQEDSLGTIEVGKRADFTVFSDDIMTIPEADILTTKAVMTIVDGHVVFDAAAQ